MSMGTLSHAARFRFRPLPPYDFGLTVRKPAGWSWFTPFEVWEGGTIWSGFWFDLANGPARRRVPVGVRARPAGRSVVADVFASAPLSSPDRARLRRHLAEALGVREDLRPFYRLMRRHRILKRVAGRLRGMHAGWRLNVFTSLTLAVLLQMAPIKRSMNMWDCLIRRYGKRVSFDGRSVRLWPDVPTIAALRPRDLARRCRLGYRAKFLVRLARQLQKGFPSVEELAAMTPGEAKARLLELYGVGEYSASFASPHPAFSLDVWSVKIFFPILFGRSAPSPDPRAGIPRAVGAAEERWGKWSDLVLVYVLNDLPDLARRFKIPIA
jgi:3-methyladenine DNA glycosylase/8-oxoguanine DNA glycosylase